MKWLNRTERSEKGQILVIVAGGLIAMIAAVGLVVDGGYAWGQQRQTQNGADAIANAGATVIAQDMKGAAKTGGDVGCAIETSASLNGLANPRAGYTDVEGNLLGVDVPACGALDAIPPAAQGVKATGDRNFTTFMVRVVGIDQLTSTASATAVAGILTNSCNPSDGCALLPVTFPQTISSCDGTSKLQVGTKDYPIVSPDLATAANESIVPLCSPGPGAVGWLDFGSCGNLADQITDPCDVSYPLPTWLHSEPGNMNNVETKINTRFAGPQLGVADDGVAVIPINSNTCVTKPADDEENCPQGDGSGNGNNFYYRIEKITGFMLDRAYIGNGAATKTACNNPPGDPFIGGNGATGCFKGWFTYYSTVGPVGPGATDGNDPGAIGIQLIR